jgi:AcrR family transcriptional regulator
MKKLGVRERIIETASDLFYNQGFNQTGINQIIKESNVAKASMYQHFRSKEDIAVAYLIERHTMWMGQLAECVSVQNTSKGKVIGCFDFLAKWLTEVNFRGCGWQNIITDLPEDHHKIKQQAILHKNDVRKWIHDLLISEDQYSIDEAKELGDEVLILLEGAIILSQIQKDEWPIKVAKKACVKILA